MINLNFLGEDERRALGTGLVSDLTAKTLWRQTIQTGSAQKISVCFSLTLNNTLTYGFCNFSEKEGLTKAEFLFRRRIYIIFFVLYITFSVATCSLSFFLRPSSETRETQKCHACDWRRETEEARSRTNALPSLILKKKRDCLKSTFSETYRLYSHQLMLYKEVVRSDVVSSVLKLYVRDSFVEELKEA